MARFLIDEDLPPSLCPFLRHQAHEAAHLTELGFRGFPDPAVFKLAQEREAVLISRDLGFANILQYAPGSHCGIVIVRFPSEMRTRIMVAEVIERLTTIRNQEFSGSLIVLEPGKIRIRRSI
jgi:predicted nuclease of predicted toxin-antitoxin system